jgi:Holliday junction resolvase RusA-like endonuclease
MQLVAEFEVFGQTCVPWSMPDRRMVGRTTKFVKDVRLVAWQERVTASARKAMGGATAELGPVLLAIEFFKETPPGKVDGDWWEARIGRPGDPYAKLGGPMPDLANLFKGTEDALARVVIGNDAQVVAIQTARLYGPQCGVRVRAYAVEPGDRPPWQPSGHLSA